MPSDIRRIIKMSMKVWQQHFFKLRESWQYLASHNPRLLLWRGGNTSPSPQLRCEHQGGTISPSRSCFSSIVSLELCLSNALILIFEFIRLRTCLWLNMPLAQCGCWEVSCFSQHGIICCVKWFLSARVTPMYNRGNGRTPQYLLSTPSSRAAGRFYGKLILILICVLALGLTGFPRTALIVWRARPPWISICHLIRINPDFTKWQYTWNFICLACKHQERCLFLTWLWNTYREMFYGKVSDTRK